MTPIVKQLKDLQADCLALFMKIHNFHWNVKGHDFLPTHMETQAMYELFADIFDDLAERVVQLGEIPLTSLDEIAKHTTVKTETRTKFVSKDVHTAMLEEYKNFRAKLKQLADTAGEADDRGTQNYCDDKITHFDKAIWQLNARIVAP
ncbi:hypothetical protein BKH43_01280 [Helicobacter sp. 13S00401-1]|uniref:Dps family protein n=1 Tax=Helicobacter sp. 13S00401-1 TaxID=1905758 RepID=UPI000BA70C6B|nr:DNA starvation/stationary phase protection protein [Helicobacter sp. 13S00401-1]PAF51892.1 hypothetical protein BKH43_01280 [Helicobacter sp. 13S00401-1]